MFANLQKRQLRIKYKDIYCLPLYPVKGRRGARAFPSWLQARARVTLNRSPAYFRACELHTERCANRCTSM